MRRAFLVDMHKCIGCRGCAMACKNFNQLEPEMVWRQVYPLAEAIYPHQDRAFLSLSCNHCANPVCLSNCPVNAYEKRADGVVIQHQDKCIGCTNCVRTCPYGAPRFNPIKKQAEKCSFCYQRLDVGLLPVCIAACPVKALTLIDLDNLTDPAIQYPAGYPDLPSLNPGTRFILAQSPVVIGG